MVSLSSAEIVKTVKASVNTLILAVEAEVHIDRASESRRQRAPGKANEACSTDSSLLIIFFVLFRSLSSAVIVKTEN